MGLSDAGFFSRSELGGLSAKDRKTKGGYSKGACSSCNLSRSCKTPKIPITGKGKRGILIIAEAPGEKEDAQGIQLIGPAGQVCRRVLDSIDIDLDRDCWKTNAVRCRPPANRTPTDEEINNCRQHILDAVKKYEPWVIIPMGTSALQSVIGHRWFGDLGGINRWRGWVIPDYELNAWICPTYHPSYVLRHMGKTYSNHDFDDSPVTGLMYLKDLCCAVRQVEKPLPRDLGTSKCVVIDERGSEAVRALAEASKDGSFVSFDFETTGLKPFTPGHRIVTCAISDSPNQAVAFPVNDYTKPALVAFLKSRAEKTAHNIKFEDQWARVILGTQVRGWRWCSMLASHVEDNRDEICGLKFQAFVRMGVFDYSEVIDPYKSSISNEHGANSFNRITEAPWRSLLLYNGLDALLQRRLALIQMKALEGRSR